MIPAIHLNNGIQTPALSFGGRDDAHRISSLQQYIERQGVSAERNWIEKVAANDIDYSSTT
jgi:hypothetical protein